MNLTFTTPETSASEALSLGVRNFVNRKSDVAPWIQKAIEADPECSMAHAVQGLMLQLARHSSLRPALVAVQEKASSTAANASAREQHYVKALEACVEGDLPRAISHYETILANDPTDLLAVVLCQSELFWMGEMSWSENISARVEPAWTTHEEGYAGFLAVRAFDLEETNQFAAAETAGRACVELEPDNVWGAHSVAHVMLMQNRAKEGGQWLDGLSANWENANQLKFHLWWHRCLFHLERREHDAALVVHDQWIRNRDNPLMQAMPDLYIDLQNGASLLWRLEQAGVDVGERWLEMAELVTQRLDDMTSPFTSAHFAVILAAVGDFASADVLVANMQGYTSSTDTLATPYAQSALPAARAALAHRRGEHEKVVAELFVARRQLWQMGGSHAQQELFMQMLHDSARRIGRNDVVAITTNDLERQGFVEPHRRVAYALSTC